MVGSVIMDRQLNKRQYLIWLIVGVYLLFVPIMYQAYYKNTLLSFNRLALYLFILGLNLFLILWVMRNRLTKETISFIVLLLTFSSIIFTFDPIFPSWLSGSVLFILLSFFPVIFFNFYVYLISNERYDLRNSKHFIYILLGCSLVREFFGSIVRLPNVTVFLFILSIFLCALFCVIIYQHAKKNRSLKWSSKESREILLVSFFGIAPFILFSILPNLILQTNKMPFLWTIGFVIIIPIAVGRLFSEHNLIIHRYWKVSLVMNYILLLVFLSLTWVVLYLIGLDSIMELIIASHYFFILGYCTYIALILYTEYRKLKVQEKLRLFEEERNYMTFHQLKNQVFKRSFIHTSSYWKAKWNIEEVNLYERINGRYSLLFNNDNERIEIDEKIKNESTIIMNESHSYPYDVIIFRSTSFSKEERLKIKQETTKWLAFLVDQEKLLDLKYKLEDRSYTALEKAIYLREMKLADVYHEMISRYLHDDILQYLYYMKQMSFDENDVSVIQKRIDYIIGVMEKSIKLKTIEWMGYPDKQKKIDYLIDELFQTLEKSFHTNITIDMDLDVDSFEKSFQETKSLLYRSVKECIVNSFKHSKAKNLYVSINKTNNIWNVRVIDDGIGWDGNLDSTT